MASDLTINEALIWLKTLKERHAELIVLRNENSASTRRRFGMAGDKEEVRTPIYDIKMLDKLVTQLAREVRKLDQCIKGTNAQVKVIGYQQDETVLGEVN